MTKADNLLDKNGKRRLVILARHIDRWVKVSKMLVKKVYNVIYFINNFQGTAQIAFQIVIALAPSGGVGD